MRSGAIEHMLEVNHPEPTQAQRHAQVPYREGCALAGERRQHVVEVGVITSDRCDGAFVDVDPHARCLSKGMQNLQNRFYLGGDGVEEENGIVSIKAGVQLCFADRQSRKDPRIGGNLKNLLQRVEREDEQQGREGVTLEQTAVVSERFAFGAIDENCRGA
jgi:hypothetical protein